MILFFLSFLAGILTVLAPCVLPLLPVIVGSSLAGKTSRLKAIIVTLSLGISVFVFTLILKVSTIFITIPQSVWEWISGIIIIVFGLITLFPGLWDKLSFTSILNRKSNQLLAVGYQKHNFLGDIIIGAALGPVFSSCSPTYFLILASVLPARPIVGIIDLIAYCVGMCISLLCIAFLGQKVLEKFEFASNPDGWFKRALGILFIIVGLAIFLGIDQKVEAALVGSNSFDITKVEQFFLQRTSSKSVDQNGISPDSLLTNNILTNLDQTNASTTTSTSTENLIDNTAARIAAKAKIYPRAPEITDPSGFINTNGQPITFSQFRGKKVVLVDIWTYSCINCQRTLPYIKAWYDKYNDEGLEIIGIHTPEFSFEKVLSNVQDAANRLGLKYPIVLDNNYGTWNAFQNEYWPRKYLIDTDGFIVYDHAGEGGYDEMERAIQAALKERNQILGTNNSISTSISNPQNAVTVDMENVQSPETYFGSNRNEFLANGTQGVTGSQTLHASTNDSTLEVSKLYLDGTWNFVGEYATNSGPAKIVYKFSAKNVYLVGSSDSGARLKIIEDGNVISQNRGSDVANDGTVTIQGSRLYNIVSGTDYGEHTLEIDIESGSLHAFTFTFG